MNTQVRLQSSLFRLAGRVNSELVGSMRNTELIIRELKVETLPKMSYLLFIS